MDVFVDRAASWVEGFQGWAVVLTDKEPRNCRVLALIADPDKAPLPGLSQEKDDRMAMACRFGIPVAAELKIEFSFTNWGGEDDIELVNKIADECGLPLELRAYLTPVEEEEVNDEE